MKEQAINYYNEGYNCSQCLLKAASDKYNINIADDTLKGFCVINNGFGIGGMCCALVAACMIFGIMFSEDCAKIMRLRLLSDFQKCHCSINCGALSKYRDKNDSCVEIISYIADISDRLICEYGG